MGQWNYRELRVWQQAMDLCEQVYALTKSWPADERFGLTSQTRRAVVSVSANIAEGQGRGNDKEFAHFLRISHGSLREVETLVELAARLGYSNGMQVSAVLKAADEIGKGINALRTKIRS